MAYSETIDDKPDDGEEVCEKYFKKGYGWSYCFLFFCPKHGHCYGFHIISGAEGRKDPFYALMKYLPVAPRIIFYDNACQLSEYALNREPGHFLKTLFFHDIFHGVNHTCPYAFNCEAIANKRCFNTSCAEQFNSYFVKIKATGRCLKLARFMLYAQHMMYLWNLDRTKYCKDQEQSLRNRVQPKVTRWFESDTDESDDGDKEKETIESTGVQRNQPKNSRNFDSNREDKENSDEEAHMT